MKNNLKIILTLQKKTQKQLAENTGITESAISRYIKGNRNPNSKSMLKIADYLDLNVEDIWSY